MPSYRHYANAPITEALIDIKVEMRPDFDSATLDAVCSSASSHYPVKRRQFYIEQQFSEAAEPQFAGKREPIGYQCRSADDLQILQVRRDGFTLAGSDPTRHGIGCAMRRGGCGKSTAVRLSR